MQVTIQPPIQSQKVATVKLVRNLSGNSLRESLAIVEQGKPIVIAVMSYATEEMIRQMIMDSKVDNVALDVERTRPTLKQAIAKCSIFTFEGLMASTVDHYDAGEDGTIEFDAVASDGLVYGGVFLANQEVHINDNGEASITDLDGEAATICFFIPMQG